MRIPSICLLLLFNCEIVTKLKSMPGIFMSQYLVKYSIICFGTKMLVKLILFFMCKILNTHVFKDLNVFNII